MFSKHMGIDLGTANTLVYIKGRGVIINEPSVVALNTSTGKVHAVGNDAKDMLGRTPGEIAAIRPLKDGVIADFAMTQAMLKFFIKKGAEGRAFFMPKIVVCVPSGVTEVERRAVEEACLSAGAREAFLIEEPMAAAIGAKLPIGDPRGSMVVDIGGGTTEMAIISLGGVVTAKSLRVAGDALDSAIVNFIKKEYNLHIGERTAEEIKKAIGSALPYPDEEAQIVKGKDLVSGLPREVDVHPADIRLALAEPLRAIVDAIKLTLERTPPELSSDVMQHGITLTGGGAYLKMMDKMLQEETGINAYIAEDAAECVVLGTGRVLDELSKLKSVLIQNQKRK